MRRRTHDYGQNVQNVQNVQHVQNVRTHAVLKTHQTEDELNVVEFGHYVFHDQNLDRFAM